MSYFSLFGHKILPFNSMAEMAKSVVEGQQILISVNALTLLNENAELAALTQQHVGYIDGIGTWIVARRYGHAAGVRIAGADLWLEILRHKPSARIYCIGATKDVIESTVAKLKTEFPDLHICGYRDGFLRSAEEEEEVIADVARTRPDFVFVAMGQPRQELLAARMFERHPALYAGLGGSFDVYCGKLDRAPLWLQKCGLEWLYRLVQEPSRWRRMLPLLRILPLLLKPPRSCS